jgi:hypothetical protein
MSFLKRLFGGNQLDGSALAQSSILADYAQIDLLTTFAQPRALHDAAEQQRWNRILPRSYEATIALFQKQGWLQQAPDGWQVSAAAQPFVGQYEQRLAAEKAEVMVQVRRALQDRDSSEALALRRAYEARQPLGKASWTGEEPQLSHSALTRRILFLNHWLLEGLSPETVEWLKFYAAEQHLWGTTWRLPISEVPTAVQQELSKDGMDGSEAAYWRAYGLILLVENQETWQRCKGGDHVRRIEITGPNDEATCETCRTTLGKQFLVARVPELPHKTCTSPYGCRCRYEPVLESYDER